MNLLAQMNEAMKYLEDNLTEEIDVGRMSQIAGCSEYHFRRMFSYLSGMPLNEYVRFRKLSLAGTLLRQGNKVIDCSLMLGYESVDAFSKAFHVMHGIPPSEAKHDNAVLKSFPPMAFKLTISGGYKMEYQIIHNSSFKIVGFKKRITSQFEGVNPQMNSIYEKLTPERIIEMKSLCNIEPHGMLSVSANFSERTKEGTELDQYIGVATTKNAPADYDVLKVNEADWVVFTIVGPFPNAIQDTWAQIYSEWLPSSNYELTGGPEILWHESPDLTKPDCKSKIWIPISKR